MQEYYKAAHRMVLELKYTEELAKDDPEGKVQVVLMEIWMKNLVEILTIWGECWRQHQRILYPIPERPFFVAL